MPDKNQLTNQDQNQAQFLGRKLGFLIGASTLPDDVKQAWLTILPELSLEQIGRLIDILEAKYLDEQTQDVNQKLEQELKQIQSKYQEKRDQLDADALEKIKDLEKQVDNAGNPSS